LKPLPFQLVNHMGIGGSGRETARFTCQRCGAHAEFPLVRTSRAFNPDLTIARAAAGGWLATRNKCECPRCQLAAKARSKGESPGPKPAPPPFATFKTRFSPGQESTMADLKMRDATPQERVKIRAVLDKQFDDGAGCWLDGYSDQKAGEEVGVPWAIVTRIREAAYGPIRVDPEVAGLRAELAQIGRELAALTEKHAAAAKRLEGLASKRAA